MMSWAGIFIATIEQGENSICLCFNFLLLNIEIFKMSLKIIIGAAFDVIALGTNQWNCLA